MQGLKGEVAIAEANPQDQPVIGGDPGTHRQGAPLVRVTGGERGRERRCAAGRLGRLQIDQDALAAALDEQPAAALEAEHRRLTVERGRAQAELGHELAEDVVEGVHSSSSSRSIRWSSASCEAPRTRSRLSRSA